MPPMHILNAPTKLMKNVGYGKGYAYDHNADEGFSGQDYWPEEMERADLLRADRPRVRGAREGAAGLLERAAQRAATKRPTKRVKQREQQGASEMYQVDPSAYWQAQMMNWGPKILIAILILVATWVVARAVKWVLAESDRPHPRAQAGT